MNISKEKHNKLLEVLKSCSKQWRNEIEYYRDSRLFDPDYMRDNNNDAGDDVEIFSDIMDDIEEAVSNKDKDATKLYKAGRGYLIAAGIYRIISDEEIAKTYCHKCKAYSFIKNKQKYVFDSGF
jgi:hypothetical protein